MNTQLDESKKPIKALGALLLCLCLLALMLVYIIYDKKMKSARQASVVNFYTTVAQPALAKDSSNQPPSHKTMTQGFVPLLVDSNSKYLTQNIDPLVSFFITKNMEAVFAHNNFDSLFGDKKDKQKTVLIVPISTNREALIWKKGESFGVIDFVRTNNETKVDVLTPVKECENRNLTAYKNMNVTITCEQIPLPVMKKASEDGDIATQ